MACADGITPMEMLAGVALSAALLGVTHGLEPDHLAGVSALASEGGQWRAGVVGTCFAAGHVTLVAAWILVGSLLVGRLPVARLDALGGTALGVVLLGVALITTQSGLRTFRGADHAHVAIALADRFGHPDSIHGYLSVGLVGALFTLSPPLSMLAFVTGVLPVAGTAAAWLAVLAYAAGIMIVMTGMGFLAGGAFATLKDRDSRTHGAGQLLAAGVVGGLGLVVLVG